MKKMRIIIAKKFVCHILGGKDNIFVVNVDN